MPNPVPNLTLTPNLIPTHTPIPTPTPNQIPTPNSIHNPNPIPTLNPIPTSHYPSHYLYWSRTCVITWNQGLIPLAFTLTHLTGSGPALFPLVFFSSSLLSHLHSGYNYTAGGDSDWLISS